MVHPSPARQLLVPSSQRLCTQTHSRSPPHPCMWAHSTGGPAHNVHSARTFGSMVGPFELPAAPGAAAGTLQTAHGIRDRLSSEVMARHPMSGQDGPPSEIMTRRRTREHDGSSHERPSWDQAEGLHRWVTWTSMFLR